MSSQAVEPFIAMRLIKKTLAFADIFLLILLFLFCYFSYHLNIGRLHIEGYTENGDPVTVYWRGSDSAYSPDNWRLAYIDPSSQSPSVLLPGLGRVAAVRIDLPVASSLSTFTRISFSQPGFSSVIADSSNSFNSVIPLNKVQSIAQRDGRLLVVHGPTVPFLEFQTAARLHPLALFFEISKASLALLVIMGLYLAAKKILVSRSPAASHILGELTPKDSAVAMFFFTVMAVLLLYHTPFGQVLRKDAFAYLVKAIQVVHGDFSPLEHGVMGWPILQAFFLNFFDVSSIFTAMPISRFLSVLIMSSLIFPFYMLGRKALNPYGLLIGLSGITLSPRFIYMGRDAMTEPLFLFLVVSTMVLLVHEKQGSATLLGAAVLAGLSFWVRPNGLFLFPVVYLTTLVAVVRGRQPAALLVTVPVVFMCVVTPLLYNRWHAFGSPLHFGANSKYLVDSYQDVWNTTVTAPTLMEYLATHTWHDYYQKFIDNGLFKVIGYVNRLPGHVWPYLFWIGCAYYLFVRKDKKLLPVWLVFVFFIGGLIPVAEIYGTLRHVYVLLPFLILVAAGMLGDTIALLPWRTARILCLSLWIFYLINHVGVPDPPYTSSPAIPILHDRWAKWSAKHLTGTAAIIEGADLIQMHLPLQTLAAANKPDTNPSLTLYRPGNYPDLASAMQDLDAMGTRYLFLDPMNIRQRPFFKELYTEKWQDTWSLKRTFRSLSGPPWIIPEIDLFERISRDD